MGVQLFSFGIILFFCFNSFAQPLFEENFDYGLGTLTTLADSWTESPTGSTDIEVFNNNLSYSNYTSSNIGKKIILDGGASGRSGIISAFTSQSGNGSTIYISFLINVISTSDMDINTSEGARFFNLKVTGSSTSRSCVFVRQGSTASQYQIGLGKLNSSTPVWYLNELDINTTYLIVVSYHFQAGEDLASMWINPDLSGSEPLANLTMTTGSDASNLEEVQFRQESLSGDMEIDGLRVATSWSEAPLPVELSSFSATKLGNSVKLNWQTATEVNNYGFEIERQVSNRQLAIGNQSQWERIGFVKGNGNSNSPKEYSFVDTSPQTSEVSPIGMDNHENLGGFSSKVIYRLKQIDNDGKFEYSKTAEVFFAQPLEFSLNQNFPNPFNPTTTISYSIPKDGRVKLVVYNLLGQPVKTLADGYRQAGTHSIEFNADKLSSGLYFYKLETDGLINIKKMTVLK